MSDPGQSVQWVAEALLFARLWLEYVKFQRCDKCRKLRCICSQP
jgi:hypothetical protein